MIRSEIFQHETLKEYSNLIGKAVQIEELNNNTVSFLCRHLNLMGLQIYKTTSNGELTLIKAKGVHTNLTNEMRKSLLDILDENKVREIKKELIVDYGTAKIEPKYTTFFPVKYFSKEWLFVVYSNYYLTKERKSLITRVLNEYKKVYESAEIYEKMQDMAAIDELTGLYNRRFGMKRLQEEYKRALRMEKPLSLNNV